LKGTEHIVYLSEDENTTDQQSVAKKVMVLHDYHRAIDEFIVADRSFILAL
jgi:hypothetical protein